MVEGLVELRSDGGVQCKYCDRLVMKKRGRVREVETLEEVNLVLQKDITIPGLFGIKADQGHVALVEQSTVQELQRIMADQTRAARKETQDAIKLYTRQQRDKLQLLVGIYELEMEALIQHMVFQQQQPQPRIRKKASKKVMFSLPTDEDDEVFDLDETMPTEQVSPMRRRSIEKYALEDGPVVVNLPVPPSCSSLPIAIQRSPRVKHAEVEGFDRPSLKLSLSQRRLLD